MAPSQVTREWRDWVGLITRIILGCGLFYAGALKVGNLAANVAQVELYQLPVPSWAETVIGTIQPLRSVAGSLQVLSSVIPTNGPVGCGHDRTLSSPGSRVAH